MPDTTWFSITLVNVISGQEATVYQPGTSVTEIDRQLRFRVLALTDAESSPVKLTVREMPRDWAPGALAEPTQS
jgi:hypothetical protein